MKKILFALLCLSSLTFYYSCLEDACEGVTCENGGTCVEGVCDCINGYSGIFCETAPIDPCDLVNCGSNGNCVNGACECSDGYSGVNCEVAPDPCGTVNCLNGGSCINGACNCINGYSGVNCEIPPDPCGNLNCQNGGTCVDGTCNCINGYTGVNCEIAPDPCANVECFNGGTCIDGTCNCIDGFTGVNCEIPPVDPCANVVCENGGSCALNQNGEVVCDCPEGFYGANCELIECFIVDCPLNSTCVDDGTGSCECNPGYEPRDLGNGDFDCGNLSRDKFLGNYLGEDICQVLGESDAYETTIEGTDEDLTALIFNNFGGYDVQVIAFIESPTNFSIPKQDFEDIGISIEGVTFGSINLDLSTTPVSVSYRVTLLDDGSGDECDMILFKE